MTAKDHRTWLIDKSALARLGDSVESDEWEVRIERGLVRIATVTLLEVGYSARSAVEVQLRLADRGHHRAQSIPDLLIAATAELAGLVVLHLDEDFELIADLTGQPLQRLELAA